MPFISFQNPRDSIGRKYVSGGQIRSELMQSSYAVTLYFNLCKISQPRVINRDRSYSRVILPDMSLCSYNRQVYGDRAL